MFDDRAERAQRTARYSSRNTRRRFLASATAFGAAAIASPAILRTANAKDLTKVKMILAWLPEGSYAYAYVAKKKGYWEKRGLDVDIARGYGSLASAQSVSNGQFDFGMSNPASIVLLAAKQVDLSMIGLMDYNAFMAVGLRKNSPIKAPKDLEGKTVGQTLSSSDAAFFPLFCDKAGVDISKVHRQNMDAKDHGAGQQHAAVIEHGRRADEVLSLQRLRCGSLRQYRYCRHAADSEGQR
jgi:ABC-type nitrate/sulfonate/bicarbonate transport system substrate-binding protein